LKQEEQEELPQYTTYRKLPMETTTPTMRDLMPNGFIKELAKRTGCKSASQLSGVISLENAGSRLWPAITALARETNPTGFALWQAAQQHATAA